MRRAGVGFIAAVLALAGCKNTDTKPSDTKSPAGVAGRPKKDSKDNLPAKGPAWLDDVGRLPGTGTAIPKGGKPTDPLDPNFDPKHAAQDVLGGRVLDPDGKPARNILVRIEPVSEPVGGPASLGIYTKNDGYFLASGLKPGKAYDLIAQATTQDGRKLTGVVQTKVPNPILLIVLRDDLPPPLKGPDSGTFPPDPKPSDKVGDFIPPTGMPTTPKPSDGAWKPGGPVTGVPPTSIGGTAPKPTTPPAAPTDPPSGAVPPPDDLSVPPPKPVKPENVADGPKDKFKPPAVNIPGAPGGPPPVPQLPPLPPSFAPTKPPGGNSSLDIKNAPGQLVLLDTLERRWELDAVRPGSLVLVEFTTSTCVPCKQVIPILKDFQSRYGASGLQVAAVLCDDVPQARRAATAAKYSRDHNLNYTLYIEPGAAGSVRNRFDVESYPHAVLLDTSGRVLWKGHPGERAKLESAIKKNLGK